MATTVVQPESRCLLLIVSSFHCRTESIPTKATENNQTKYRTVEIDGLSIAYREAGSPNAPTLLLLHGFPTSSHMFRNLIPALSDQFHLVAPDYPGYGNSSMPAVRSFQYSLIGAQKLLLTT